jgi:hypothetical protein
MTTPQQHRQSRELRRKLSNLLTNRFGPAMMALMMGAALIIRSMKDFTDLYTLPVPLSALSDDARYLFIESKRNYELLLQGFLLVVIGFICLLFWVKAKYETHLADSTQRKPSDIVDR